MPKNDVALLIIELQKSMNRLEDKIDAQSVRLENNFEKKFDDHEERLSSVEKFRTQVLILVTVMVSAGMFLRDMLFGKH